MFTAHSFSPDGLRLVLVDPDSVLHLVDVPSGRPTGVTIALKTGVNAAGFCNQGAWVYAAGADGQLRLFDAANGAPVAKPLAHPKGLSDCVVAPGKGLVLAALGQDFQVYLWQADKGLAIGKPLAHKAQVRAAVFEPNGKRLITASDDRQVRFWNVADASADGNGLVHPDRVLDLDLCAGNTQLWTRCADGQLRLWDLTTRKLLGEPIRHDKLSAACSTATGKVIASAGADGLVLLWDAIKGASLGKGLSHKAAVTALQGGTAGAGLLATGTADGRVQIWQGGSGLATGSALSHAAPVNELRFDPTQQRLATLAGGQVQLWDVTSGKPLGKPIPLGPQSAPAPADGGTGTATATGAGLVRIGQDQIVEVGGVTGVFTPISSQGDTPLGADERRNLQALIDRLKQEVAASASTRQQLEADLAKLRDRPAAPDDFATGVQQSLDELQQRMSGMRNGTSNFAIREFKLEASVYVQVTPLGSIEYRFVQPGDAVASQALSKLSLQIVPLPKDDLAGVWTRAYFQPDLPISALPEINAEQASRLEQAGLYSIGEFLQTGTRARATAYLEALLGVNRQRLAIWAQQATLMTLRGMEGPSALLLIAAGLGSFEQLAELGPIGLQQRYEAMRLQRPDLEAPAQSLAQLTTWLMGARQYLGQPTDDLAAGASPG